VALGCFLSGQVFVWFRHAPRIHMPLRRRQRAPHPEVSFLQNRSTLFFWIETFPMSIDLVQASTAGTSARAVSWRSLTSSAVVTTQETMASENISGASISYGLAIPRTVQAHDQRETSQWTCEPLHRPVTGAPTADKLSCASKTRASKEGLGILIASSKQPVMSRLTNASYAA
jgi:hypothetical protein